MSERIEALYGKSVEDLVRIAAAGGGFVIDSKKASEHDLVRIAAAGGGKARIVIQGANGMAVDALVKIAAAGKGSVSFAG